MPPVVHAELRPGDIFIDHQMGGKGHRYPWPFRLLHALNPSSKGNLLAGHTGLIGATHGPDSATIIDIAFNAGKLRDGIGRTTWGRSRYDFWSDGRIAVYRYTAPTGELLAKAAAEVALTWSDNRGSLRIKLPHWKDVLHVMTRPSSLDARGRSRADFYLAHREDRGGPPGINHEIKTLFCSQFVIACYQAVGGAAWARQDMALNASNTSPVALDGYLAHHPAWTLVEPPVKGV